MANSTLRVTVYTMSLATNLNVSQLSLKFDNAKAAVTSVIVGQEYLVERLLISTLAKGHILLEGVPGLAKTKTVKTFSKVCNVNSQRIQFTPDLMPSDVVGTRIWSPGTGEFITELGPICTNFLLADEINRASAKVQSALLQAMEERQVTIGKTTYTIAEPFMVLATQNPVESEGTFTLPAAQIDRFLMKVTLTYPTKKQEMEILRRHISEDVQVNPIVTADDILNARALCQNVHVPKNVALTIIDIVHATRHPHEVNPAWEGVTRYGAGVRGSLALTTSAQARAFLKGRDEVVLGDLAELANDTLAHRICISHSGAIARVSESDIVKGVLAHVGL